MATSQKVKLGYQKKTLGEVVDFIDGDRGTNYPSQGEFFASGDCLFLSTKNVPNRKFTFEEKMFIDAEKDAVLRKGKLQRGDYVLTTRGTVGNFAYYDEHVPYENVRINSGMVILRKKLDELDEKFFRYYLSSSSFSEQVKSRVSGSAQPQLPIRDMASMEIILPDLKKQARIASVLSAYDDLIENNEKRIKALEEVAQLLYTEWFVKFKFPGREKVKVVDSGTEYGMVPKGWEIGSISRLANVISGFPFKGSTYQDSGKYKIVTIKNVHDGKFVLNFDSFIDELPSKLPATCVLKSGDVLLSLTGNVGRVCVVYGLDHLLNQRVAKLSPLEKNKREYVYSLFRQKRFQQKLEAMSNGAAQQNLSPIQVKDINVIIPSSEILDKFSQLTSKYFDLSLFLQEDNQNLAKTRDLLIPQLVTGKRELK